MKKFKVSRNVFIALALLLSYRGCIVVAFSYARMLCAIEHKGFSAPADTAFLYAIPYGIGIMICGILALVFHKKLHKRSESK